MSQLRDLRVLNLWNCMRITEGGLAAALGGLTRLADLSLRGSPHVGDGVMRTLARLPRLRRLDLRACEHIRGTVRPPILL